jgi:hypothetical protein
LIDWLIVGCLTYIARYKVGLGTSPGDDDIMPFTDVGLQTCEYKYVKHRLLVVVIYF